MSRSPTRMVALSTLGLVLAGLVAAACRDAAPTGPDPMPSSHADHDASALLHRGHGGSPGGSSLSRAELAKRVAKLRLRTAAFHRFENAERAGWGTRITGCMTNPGVGGMGYHYGNVGLIDDRVDEMQPELLLYEPLPNGKLRFVAVEYIVPFDVWTNAEPPELFGIPFHRNEAFGLWVLHVWHYKHNPSGMFSDWNPRVSCEHAQP